MARGYYESNRKGSGKTVGARRGSGGFWFSVTGVDQVERAFRKLPKAAAKRVIRKAMRPAMKGVAEKVRELVPVDSGLTRANVKVRAATRSRKGFGINVQIGEGDYKGVTFYAAFIEYGTVKIPAARFMFRAFIAMGDIARKMCERLLGQLITEEVRKLRAA